MALDLKLCSYVYVFFDTRTEAEYLGTQSMYNAARDGRIPNALWYLPSPGNRHVIQNDEFTPVLGPVVKHVQSNACDLHLFWV